MATASVDILGIKVMVQYSPVMEGMYGVQIWEDEFLKEDRIIKGDRGMVVVYLSSRLEEYIPFLKVKEVLQISENLIGYASIDALDLEEDDLWID